MALLRVALVGVAWQLSSSTVLRSSRGTGEDQLQRDAKAFAAKAVIAPKPTKLAEGSLRAGETCFDTIADWKDVQGDSCQSYHDNQYCDRANGVFFGTKTAMMLYHAGPDSAAQVCCYCGGGVIKECDEMCRLLKKHEASEIESKFDAMRDAAGDAVTEAGAASMASMVKQMNASMEDALERLHAHSSKMLKEDLAAEESSFEQMAASSVLSPKAATAETASIASKAAEAQMLKSLKHLDGTELRRVAEQAQQKFHDAEAAWELAAATSKKVFERSQSVASDLTEKIEKRVGFLDASLKPLRSADAAVAEAETEMRSAEEEAKLAEDMASHLQNETRGAEELIRDHQASENATSQSEGATKALLEENDNGIKELDMLVTQAEDLTSK